MHVVLVRAMHASSFSCKHAVVERAPLERAGVRLALIRALAEESATQVDLAARYGVEPSAVTQFKQRHADRIASVRQDLANEFAGIAYADKRNRVDALSQQVDDVIALLADPDTAARAGVQYAEMARVVQTGLRAISEELGQLPGRQMSVNLGGSLDVQINGVDVSDLK